jgi:hypothetical protein
MKWQAPASRDATAERVTRHAPAPRRIVNDEPEA